MKKNGTTTAGRPRWRCKNPHCGSSLTRTRTDKQLTRDFRMFHNYVTSTTSLSDVASHHGLSRWTLHRRFHNFWLINIPNQPDGPDPPSHALEPHRWVSTTNSLEGGINAELKRRADAHRGRGGEHQRKMLEWWLHTKTQLPDDPLDIARQCNFGQDQLAKVSDLVPEDANKADQHTGRPAFYDNAIPTEYDHCIRIRKGPMR